MTRIKRGVTVRRRHKRLLKKTKGFRGPMNILVKRAKNALMRAGLNSYRGRKQKKRDYRRLWIVRINAACRELGVKYSQLIDMMTKKDMRINRKMLSELAVNQPEVFKQIVEEAQK
ncbi:MAG: 50S ribosomal protein L20 [Candidatus Gracilibacteria bacterium]|jgi:large subunit ribosomal protein L20